MHFHFGFTLGIIFIGEGGLPVDFVLLGGDALVLDKIYDSDDDFDELDQDEEHEQAKGDKEFDNEILIEDDEEGADNDVPGEEFCNIYHFYNLPGIFKVCIFAPVGSVKTFGSPGDIIDSAESIDVEQVEVGG